MHQKHGRILVSVTCALMILSGCKDQRRHAAGGAVELTSAPADLAASATAVEAARAALSAIADAQNARARGLGHAQDREAYDSALARLAALGASREIHRNIRKTSSVEIPKSIDEKGALTVMMEQWISTLAHYVNGYHWESLRQRIGSSETNAVVHLDAENPDEARMLAEIDAAGGGRLSDQERRDRAVKMGFNIPISAGIDVKLLKIDGQWKVYRIDLGPGAAAPTTQSGNR